MKNKFSRWLCAFICVFGSVAGIALAPATAQTTYNESEPNNDFPPIFLPSDPLFQSGDRLAGTITTGDTDDQYIRIATGTTGLYRYTFTLDNPANNHLFDIYDTTPNGFFLGSNNEGTVALSNHIVFDQFDTNNSSSVFGLGLLGATDTTTFDYQVTVERTLTPVITLGTIASDMLSVSNPTTLGEGVWYRFTLASTGVLSLDTFGSLINDTEIALFSSGGETLAASDDASGTDLLSSITVSLGAGDYYLAIGGFNSRYNYNSNGTSPGDDLLGWDRHGFSGGYENDGTSHQLNLQFTAVTVPEASSGLLIIVSLLLTTGVYARKKW